MDDLKIHTLGCPITRTGRCTCTYMAQWTGPGPAYPIFPLGHLSMCLDHGGPQECSCHLPTCEHDTVCYHRTTGWHRTDRVSCQDWDHEVGVAKPQRIRVNGYGWSDCIHPKYMLDVVESQDQPEERTHTLMNGATYTVATPKHSRYSYTESYVKDLREVLHNALDEAKQWKITAAWFGGFAAAGWLLHAARAFWGF